MAREFKETAHTKTDLKKYGDNYDHIFKKYKCNCHLFEERCCNICQNDTKSQETTDSQSCDALLEPVPCGP
jgi:hypothetical protein